MLFLSIHNLCRNAESNDGENDVKPFELLLSDELLKRPEPVTNHAVEALHSETYRPWTTFTENLWTMFISEQLYISSADAKWMRKQPIWRVIQFLSVLYFEDKQFPQNQGLIYPEVHFETIWPFSSLSHIDGIRRRSRPHSALHGHPSDLYFEDQEKVGVDTGIIEYRKGQSMRAVCYLSVDWEGHSTRGAIDQNLYLATFSIEKEGIEQAPTLYLRFDLVKAKREWGVH